MNTNEIPNGSIVVAVDGSEHAARAVTWAARQAVWSGGPSRIVHVGEDGTASDVVKEVVALAHETCPEVDVHAQRDRRTGRARSSRCRRRVPGRDGVPWSRRPASTRLLGSVSAAVAKHAACPWSCPARRHEPFAKIGDRGRCRRHPRVAAGDRVCVPARHPCAESRCTSCTLRGPTRDRLASPDRAGRQAPLRAQISGVRGGDAETYPDVHVTLRLENGAIDESSSAASPLRAGRRRPAPDAPATGRGTLRRHLGPGAVPVDRSGRS